MSTKKTFLQLPYWLLGSIFIYWALLFFASWLKYHFYLYNSLDLGIFSHVLYNSIQGEWLASSIHPPSYFGDHFSPLLMIYVLFYYFLPSPLLLLALQTITLGLAAIPLYLIAKKHLTGVWLKIIVLGWLLNPFVQSGNLFEFHLLGLFPLLFFYLWHFFSQRRFIPFILTLTLIIILREDAALATLGIIPAILFYKKEIKTNLQYLIPTFLLSLSWFFAANKIVAAFSPGGEYKFLTYYSWLGSSWSEIIFTLLSQPTIILEKIFSLESLTSLLMILLPAAFLPLLAPLFVSGALIPLLPFILKTSGLNIMIIFLYYGLWVMPFIFLAYIFALKKIVVKINQPPKSKLTLFLNNNYRLLALILLAALLYMNILSPVGKIFYKLASDPSHYQASAEPIKKIIPLIEPNAPIAASIDFFTNLANRRYLYFTKYLITERHQLSNNAYDIPENLRYILLTPLNSFVYLSKLEPGQKTDLKLHTALKSFGLKAIAGNHLLFEKNTPNNFSYHEELKSLPPEVTTTNQPSNEPLALVGYQIQPLPTNVTLDNPLALYTYWQVNEPLDKNISWQLEISQAEQKIDSLLIPASLGLVPMNNWPLNTLIKSAFILPLDLRQKLDQSKTTTLALTPLVAKGKIILNRLLSTEILITKTQPLKENLNFQITIAPDKW